VDSPALRVRLPIVVEVRYCVPGISVVVVAELTVHSLPWVAEDMASMVVLLARQSEQRHRHPISFKDPISTYFREAADLEAQRSARRPRARIEGSGGRVQAGLASQPPAAATNSIGNPAVKRIGPATE